MPSSVASRAAIVALGRIGQPHEAAIAGLIRMLDDGRLERQDLGPALPADDLCLRAARACRDGVSRRLPRRAQPADLEPRGRKHRPTPHGRVPMM